MQDNKRYTVYIERDAFADREKYPDGVAWCSGIMDDEGELIDGQGDIASYNEARELLLATLERLI